jgi:histidine triad (HIT) family protein
LIENPSQLKVVSETDNFYAWLDINPRAKGYTMIVPKEHMGSIEEFSPAEYQEAMNLVRKVVDKAKQGLGADGVSVTMNVGEAAGQMVPHAYIQVFPRFEDEETSGTPTGAIFQPHEEAKKNLDEIKDKMASVDSDFGQTTKEAHPDSQKFKDESASSGEVDEIPEDEPGGKDEAIDKIGGQLGAGSGSGSPLQLGSGESKTKSRGQENSEKESRTSAERSSEEDSGSEEVRLDEDFDAKSFEWK